jgi:hypothetical protein
MKFTGLCRSVINGWRIQRALARNRRSLRSVSAALWLPVHRLSDDELDASVVSFSWLARMYGMPHKDVAASVRTVREAHADARQRHG